MNTRESSPCRHPAAPITGSSAASSSTAIAGSTTRTRPRWRPPDAVGPRAWTGMRSMLQPCNAAQRRPPHSRHGSSACARSSDAAPRRLAYVRSPRPAADHCYLTCKCCPCLVGLRELGHDPRLLIQFTPGRGAQVPRADLDVLEVGPLDSATINRSLRPPAGPDNVDPRSHAVARARSPVALDELAGHAAAASDKPVHQSQQHAIPPRCRYRSVSE